MRVYLLPALKILFCIDSFFTQRFIRFRYVTAHYIKFSHLTAQGIAFWYEDARRCLYHVYKLCSH